jgi:hypothetical protein
VPGARVSLGVCGASAISAEFALAKAWIGALAPSLHRYSGWTSTAGRSPSRRAPRRRRCRLRGCCPTCDGRFSRRA